MKDVVSSVIRWPKTGADAEFFEEGEGEFEEYILIYLLLLCSSSSPKSSNVENEYSGVTIVTL